MATMSIPHRWKYDAFVSFRGEDIRKTFMDHLFNDFKQKGIHAFSDNRELPKGEEISSRLYKAIEESRELVKILECKQIENPKHEVRIIFYDAKPDVVRKQKRSYAEAFINHEVSNKTEVDKWREGLSMAAYLSGWDLRHDKWMIGKILKTEDLTISSVAEGAIVIKQRMACKPILVVLDDVDDHKQLNSLAGSATWFCYLVLPRKFDYFHYSSVHMPLGFREVAEEVVKYVQGHPLGLIVLGRFLYGKTIGQWVSELDQLKVHPNKEIEQVLRLSYNVLNLCQQNILLDIACSFIGANRDFAASVLDGCNFFAYTNIQVLVDKSLITISNNNSLQMHDLIQAMAREINYEESIMTGKQRRLRNSSEVYNVPMTEEIDVLVLLLRESSQNVHINANSFAFMKNLRILKIYAQADFHRRVDLKGYNVKYSGSLYFLSNELACFVGMDALSSTYLLISIHPTLLSSTSLTAT
ncbi:NB-ARC domains-containing protein [Tanacetum coccineum]